MMPALLKNSSNAEPNDFLATAKWHRTNVYLPYVRMTARQRGVTMAEHDRDDTSATSPLHQLALNCCHVHVRQCIYA